MGCKDASGWRNRCGFNLVRRPGLYKCRVMKKILIVDDDTDLLHTLDIFLHKKYVVKTLSDGHTALEQAEAFKPALVMLDVNLGDMDGRDICKGLKENAATRDIPVMMMSSLAGLAAALVKCPA